MRHLILILCLIPGLGWAQMMHRHGDGGHDMMTMPGLRGVDTTDLESGEMMVMFRHFSEIERSVENLPDGIRTVTSSTNPMVMEALVSHVTGMINRVEEGRDPQVIIQSPTLTPIFAGRGKIETEIEITDEGVVVIQTSDDPEMVALLQTHAAEVTDMAERGMQAVHDRMAKQGQ